MSQIYMYMHTSIHVSNKSYYLLQQIKLSPNVFETCDPCSGFHSSWSNFLPPFQPTCSLHGVFHCPSCAGRQLPLKGRCPWESSWRIASNICRSSFQPRWDRKSHKKHIKFDTCLSQHKATQLWRNTSEIRGIENDCYLFWGPKMPHLCHTLVTQLCVSGPCAWKMSSLTSWDASSAVRWVWTYILPAVNAVNTMYIQIYIYTCVACMHGNIYCLDWSPVVDYTSVCYK